MTINNARISCLIVRAKLFLKIWSNFQCIQPGRFILDDSSIICCNGLSTRETKADILPQSKCKIKRATLLLCTRIAVCGCDIMFDDVMCIPRGQADDTLFTRPFLSSWVGGAGVRDYILKVISKFWLVPVDLCVYSTLISQSYMPHWTCRQFMQLSWRLIFCRPHQWA